MAEQILRQNWQVQGTEIAGPLTLPALSRLEMFANIAASAANDVALTFNIAIERSVDGVNWLPVASAFFEGGPHQIVDRFGNPVDPVIMGLEVTGISAFEGQRARATVTTSKRVRLQDLRARYE